MRNIYKSKMLTGLLILMTSITAFAQIPDAGFETWTSGSCGIYSYNNPTDWGSVNSSTCIIGDFTVQKTTAAAHVHSGSAALELYSQYISFASATAPGICVTGSINTTTNAVTGGFPVTSRPDKFIGWYQYAPVNPDTFSLSVSVYNSGQSTYDTIAMGYGSVSGSTTVSTYTRFIANITYNSNLPADSAQIILLCSAGANGQSGTKMYIDDLSFVSCAGFGSAHTITPATCLSANGAAALTTKVNGTAPYTYSWSNNTSDSLISNVRPGTYKVTITDFNTCTAVDTLVVGSTNVPFTLTATGSSTSCISNTGTVVTNASGGAAPYTYLWSNDSTRYEITNLGAGNYNVTVTDTNGCYTTATGAVTTPNGPSATDTVTNILCNNASTGAVAVTVSGGTAPITYNWNNGASTASITGVGAGTYTLVITDHNNCSFEVSATISQPAALALTGSGNDTVACYGDSTGTLSATTTGGTPGYSYWWSNENENSSVSNLPAGSYSVYVTDANNCTSDTLNLMVVQPDAIQVTTASTPASSLTASNGVASVAASGGTGTLSYSWVTGATGDTITHLSTATYCVTVTDINFCSATACDSVGYQAATDTTGIKTIAVNQVKIYPNPASTQLTIETNTNNGKFEFTVYGLDGKMVKQQIITGEKSIIMLNQIADGFYTYQLKDMVAGGVSNGKLEIQR